MCNTEKVSFVCSVAEDADWDVLCELVTIDEDNNQVDLELNFKLLMMVRWTRIDLWEQHVQGYFQSWQHITIGNLDVLHFSRICLSFECLCAHKLHLNWFNLQLWLITDEVTLEWVSKATICWVNLSLELEFWKFLSWWCSQTLWRNQEVSWHKFAALGWVLARTCHSTVEFCFAIHSLSTNAWHNLESDFVNNRKVNTNISVNQWHSLVAFQLELELKWLCVIKFASCWGHARLFHEIDTITDWQRWSALISTNRWYCVHICLGCQSVLGELKGGGLRISQNTSPSYKLSWLIEFTCAIELNVERGWRSGLFRHHYYFYLLTLN